MKKRKQTLNKARDLIMGDRANSYGDAHKNHDRIAKMWSVILKKEITVEQVYQCMIVVLFHHEKD